MGCATVGRRRECRTGWTCAAACPTAAVSPGTATVAAATATKTIAGAAIAAIAATGKADTT